MKLISLKKNPTIYYMLMPHFIFFSIFFLIPVFWCIYLSFFEYDLFESRFVLFQNYIELIFRHPLFYKALKNTALFALIFTPLWLVKALIISALIQQYRLKIQAFFKAVFYLPHVTSAVVLSMVWLWIYNPEFGILNYMLSLLGIEKIMWLGNPDIAIYSIIFMQILISGGASIVLISASISSIPNHIYDAAKIDGASKTRIFFKITLPLIKPVILYHIIIGLIGSFQVFSNIYVMTKGGPQFSTLTVLYLIYETAFENYNFGLASAQSVILALIICLISVFQFKFFGENIEY